jgi:hypothetical protein
LIIPESDPARVSVDTSARPKRQAVSKTTKYAIEQQKTVEQTKVLTNVEIPASQDTVSAGSEAEAKPVEQKHETVNNEQTIEHIVDEITEVLDLLGKTESDMVKGLIRNNGIGLELSNEIYAGSEAIRNMSIDTLADKQLAMDMIARIDTAEEDVSKTIELLEKQQVLKTGSVSHNWSILTTKLTYLKTSLDKLESPRTKLMNITNTTADNTETSTALSTNNNSSIPGNSSDKPTYNNTELTKNAGIS